MEKVLKAIQDDYPNDIAWCYGCGRLNENGHHFRTSWQGEETVTIYMPQPEHMAIPGFVYGGLLAWLIDCHGTGSASMSLHRKNGHKLGDGTPPPRFVTASLKVDFKKPTPQGVPLKAVGTVQEIHPKFVATGEVIAAVMPSTFLKKD